MDKTFRPIVNMKYYSTKDSALLKNALESKEYGLQLKLDGSSYCFAKDAEGKAHCWGDKISKKDGKVIDKIDNLPHIKSWIEKEFPVCSMMLGEVWTNYEYTTHTKHDRELSSYVNSIMLALPEKAAARQYETQMLQLYIFDLLWWDNEAYFDKPFSERDNLLNTLFENRNWEGQIEWLQKAETIIDNKEEMINKWLSEGREGGVLKKLSAPYSIRELGQTAARPAHVSYKIKEVDTCDVVIMDVEYPDKEYKGKNADTYEYRDEEGNPVNRLWYLGYINAFVIGAYNSDGQLVKIGTVASGLDDSIRKEAHDNPDTYIGTVIECECMSLDKNGHTIRHPRLIHLRPEKDAHDCTIEHIFGN